MDDKDEYEELLKAEAEEKRNAEMVMRAFRFLLMLILLGVLLTTANQITTGLGLLFP